MITLPFSPRRAWLISFWSTASIVGGLLVGILLAILVSPSWFIVGLLLSVMLIIPGLLWLKATLILYQAWNGLAHLFARGIRFWLLSICFYIIFVAVGRTGSTLELADWTVKRSLWTSRNVPAPTSGRSQLGVIVEEPIQRSWPFALLRWAIRSGNWWACCLIPFFFLVLVFEGEQQEETPLPATGIYTLF